MKQISVLLTAMMVFMVGSAPMKAGKAEVVLNAAQVSSAADIENAISTATNNGTRPGTVTLDSSQGDFLYTGDDRIVNVSVSNLTLRSRNGTVIRNCVDGIVLDGGQAGRITVEGIHFVCELNGIVSTSGQRDVVIRGNTFDVDGYALFLQNASRWKILENTAEALKTYAGVLIMDSSEMEVSGNRFTLYQGITLENTRHSLIRKNMIDAIAHGIVLEQQSSHNRVLHNQVLSTQYAGIWLGWQTEYNRVMGNQVQCASGFPCEVVGANEAGISPTNKIVNNQLLPDTPPLSFQTTLVGGWNTFTLGLSSSGKTYLADITPLQANLDGAHIPFTIKPVYDGEQWNDVLHAFIPDGQPDQEVQITVYDFNGLQPLFDWTDEIPTGDVRSYPIAPSGSYGPMDALFVDLDPLEPSATGATYIRQQINYEILNDVWWDYLRVELDPWLVPDPVETRMRVYKAPGFLEIDQEFTVTLYPQDTWRGFWIGPSSAERAYLVRMYPIMDSMAPQVIQYVIQPEFNGYEWNDVLRIQMGNQDTGWEAMEYNIKIFACDVVICP